MWQWSICGLWFIYFIAPASAATYQFTPLSFPGAISTSASSINNVGEIIGTYMLPGDRITARSFVYANGSFTDITRPAPSFITVASRINNLGEVTGNHFFSSLSSGATLLGGFTRTRGGSVAEFDFSGLTGAAHRTAALTAGNSSGLKIGSFQYSAPRVSGSFLWTPTGPSFGTFIDIGAVLSLSVEDELVVHDINDRGQLIGLLRRFEGKDQHFITSFPALQDDLKFITYPGATQTFVNGINDAGDVVGQFNVGPSRNGLLRTGDGEFAEVLVAGYGSEAVVLPRDINDYGVIVGATITDGLTRSGIFTLIPEPSSYLITCIGFLAMTLWVGNRANCTSSCGSWSTYASLAMCRH